MEKRCEILARPGRAPAVFATTHWSVVARAAGRESPEAQEALCELCRVYWYPLYAYVRRFGHSSVEAEDLIQEFFSRLLQGRWIEGVAPDRGKFRSWLLACLKHFLANEHDRRTALKRGGLAVVVSMDTGMGESLYRHEPVTTATPDRLFERRWALTLLEQVLARLGGECEKEGKGPLFSDLQPLLQGDEATLGFKEIGARHGMSEGAVKTAAYRLRIRYRELLREEIARTVDSPAEVDEEIRSLITALGER
jgi:RNA polymerase sigma factor (sigma-70 family)